MAEAVVRLAGIRKAYNVGTPAEAVAELEEQKVKIEAAFKLSQ